MTDKLSRFIAIAAILGLSGCASMSADECVTSDWQGIGFEDGARGYTADHLGTRRKACAKHGVTPDMEAYNKGRRQGLRQYCQPSRGYTLGESGAHYNGVCPAKLEPDFIAAYNTGRQLHTLRARVNGANNRINSKKRELDNTEDRIRSAEAKMISSETSVEDRVMVLAELKDLSERTGQLEAEIAGLIEERAMAERDLADYQAMLANTGF